MAPVPTPLAVDRYVQWAGHLLFTTLMAVGLIRALTDQHASPLPAVLGAIVVVGWYLVGVVLIAGRGRDVAGPWVLVLTVLWVGLTLMSPEFVWVAFVLAMLCWHFLPMRWAVPAELVIVAVSAGTSLRLGPAGPGPVIGPIIGIATAVAVTEGFGRLVAAAAARDALLHQLLATQHLLAERERQAGVLAERARLGTDIHDGAGQALAAIVMLLQSATADDAPAPQRLVQTRTALEMARGALAQTRDHLRGLDGTAAAPSGGLMDELSAAVARAQSLGVPTELHAHGSPVDLPAPVLAVTVRAASEALANTARHADATRAVVTVTHLGDEVHVDVVDDGCGFDPATASTSGTGFGFAATRAQVEALGGTAVVDSAPGQGTSVHVSVPVGADR